MSYAALAVEAYGAIKDSQAKKAAAEQNRNTLNNEAAEAAGTSQVQEGIQRNMGAQKQGTLDAAAAQSGISTGASSQAVGRQSAISQELDALNTRYSGVLRNDTYGEQAMNVDQAGGTAARSSLLRAGGAVISGVGKGYSGDYSFGDGE